MKKNKSNKKNEPKQPAAQRNTESGQFQIIINFMREHPNNEGRQAVIEFLARY